MGKVVPLKLAILFFGVWIKEAYFLKSIQKTPFWKLCFHCMISFSRSSSIHCIKYARIRVFTDCVLPHKVRIYDSVLIRENTCQWKLVFSHISCSDFLGMLSWKTKTFIIANRFLKPWINLQKKNFVFTDVVWYLYVVKLKNMRSKHQKCSIIQGVLRNIAKFTGKDL